MKKLSLPIFSLLCFMLVFASCSQSRYGSRMVRVKTHNIAKEDKSQQKESATRPITAAEKNTEIKKDAGLADEANEQNGETIVAEIPEVSKEEVESIIADVETTTPSSNNATFMMSKSEKVAERFNQMTQNSKVADIAVNKASKKAQKMIKKQVSKVNGDSSLLRTALIIVLLIVLVSALISLLPGPLSWILSLLLLVLAILWLLSIL